MTCLGHVCSVVDFDPDPVGSASFDRILLEFNKFNKMTLLLKIMIPLTLTRNVRQCRLALLVNKSHFHF
jgi:hypothetical protein